MIIQFPPMETRNVTDAADTATAPIAAEVVPHNDLRKVGLKSVADRLSANRGDLDVVFEARAKADVIYCPVCPEPHAA